MKHLITHSIVYVNQVGLALVVKYKSIIVKMLHVRTEVYADLNCSTSLVSVLAQVIPVVIVK